MLSSRMWEGLAVSKGLQEPVQVSREHSSTWCTTPFPTQHLLPVLQVTGTSHGCFGLLSPLIRGSKGNVYWQLTEVPLWEQIEGGSGPPSDPDEIQESRSSATSLALFTPAWCPFFSHLYPQSLRGRERNSMLASNPRKRKPVCRLCAPVPPDPALKVGPNQGRPPWHKGPHDGAQNPVCKNENRCRKCVQDFLMSQNTGASNTLTGNLTSQPWLPHALPCEALAMLWVFRLHGGNFRVISKSTARHVHLQIKCLTHNSSAQ